MSTNQDAHESRILGTVVCLPVHDPERTVAFYRNVLGLSEAQIDDGIVALELPGLSLFLMERSAFESYSRKSGRGVQFSEENTGAILSCAIETREALDAILERAIRNGGAVPSPAANDPEIGVYLGYFSDPDGHQWELAFAEKASE